MLCMGGRASAALILLMSMALAAPAGDVTSQRVTAALPELDRLAEQTLKKTGLPGMAIAVVYKDKVVHLKGLGVREIGKGDSIDADTVFQLASVSKPLASTVLAAIVGEKAIGWDDRIIDHDPGFRMYDPWVTRELTFRDLLCHRSGLPDHAGDLLEDIGYSRDEILRRLRFEKPSSSFRSQFAYTNFGYSEAGFAGARAAGMSWDVLATEKLFRPLGMKSSSYRFADFMAAQNRARTHVRVGDQWVAKYTREPDAQAPAGGASSTARDMGQWLRLQLAGGKFDGKQLIAADALGETHRPQIVNHPPKNPAIDRAGSYGLGWNVNYDDAGRVHLSHSGAFGLGAGTVVTMLPAEELGIAVLTNGMPIGAAEAVALSFVDLALTGKVEKDWLDIVRPSFIALMKPEYGTEVDCSKPIAQPTPPLPFEAYIGTYGNDYYGDLEVAAKDGSLVLRLGPKKTSFALRHWNRDVFTYQPVGENAGGLSAVTFWVGPERKAGRVAVENLDVRGQGTFTVPPKRK
jgi:CubicO group peptidase (beta-lactamase class C family)